MGVCVSQEERTWWGTKCVSFVDREEREKRSESEIIKILNVKATVIVHICIIIVHICIVTVALMHLCTILHPLIWVFFYLKCVKSNTFSIL